MAVVREMNMTVWKKWVDTRPQVVQQLCHEFPPDRLYRMTNTGKRVTIAAYNEDGSLTVDVTGEYNLVITDRQVLGVSPNCLVECDVPDLVKEDMQEVVKLVHQGVPRIEVAKRFGVSLQTVSRRLKEFDA